MLGLYWRLARGYRLCPWRSPYLRWRIETYWGLPAEALNVRKFWKFAWRHRGELWRYAGWAGRESKRRGVGSRAGRVGSPAGSRLNAT